MNERVKTLSREAMKLSPAERAELVEEIWDSLVTEPGAVGVPQWHRDELDRRLARLDADPSGTSSWEEVKARFV